MHSLQRCEQDSNLCPQSGIDEWMEVQEDGSEDARRRANREALDRTRRRFEDDEPYNSTIYEIESRASSQCRHGRACSGGSSIVANGLVLAVCQCHARDPSDAEVLLALCALYAVVSCSNLREGGGCRSCKAARRCESHNWRGEARGTETKKHRRTGVSCRRCGLFSNN